MKRTKENGITLIALIITIIVLLILAGVSIAMLTGNNGILSQAKLAKEKTILAKEDEKNKLSGNNDYISEQTGNAIPGKIVTETKKDNYVDINGDKATIPAGFTVSKIKDEQIIKNGLVIYKIPESDIQTADWDARDSIGEYQIKLMYDQFVWIPCTLNDIISNSLHYQRTEWDIEDDFNTKAIKDEKTLLENKNVFSANYFVQNNITLNIAEEIVSQIDQEEKSIDTYNGYYIGRYETGKVNNSPVVQYKKNTYDTIKWLDAYNLVKDTNISDSTNTYLCSSYSWDTAINFIQDNKISDFGSRNDGLNCNLASQEVFNHVGTLIKPADKMQLLQTGMTTSYQNIYDMLGNVSEFTTELNPTTISEECVVVRGGDFSGNISAAGRRSDIFPTYYENFIGFRITLFIK